MKVPSMKGWTQIEYEEFESRAREALHALGDQRLLSMVLDSARRMWEAEKHRQEREGLKERQTMLFGSAVRA